MEKHKNVQYFNVENRPNLEDGWDEYFKRAWEFTNQYYSDEVKKIGSVNFSEVSPRDFFTEYIWVVHATGFSAKAVSKFIHRLLEAYGDWDKLALDKFEDSFERVKKVCNNDQKAKAVHKQACMMMVKSISFDEPDLAHSWWERYRDGELSTPERLAKLPYIGKITCYHLGRNIGLLECVKPDLHLVRMAKFWGFNDCISMCKAMQESLKKRTGEQIPLGLIDLALWYSASTWGTLEIKAKGNR